VESQDQSVGFGVVVVARNPNDVASPADIVSAVGDRWVLAAALARDRRVAQGIIARAAGAPGATSGPTAAVAAACTAGGSAVIAGSAVKRFRARGGADIG
jgi:hypothetical protein